MRAVLSGTMIAFRYVQLKDNKVGQLDLLQTGDKRYPSKVVPIYITNSAYSRLILENLEKYRDPFITLLIWINDTGRETVYEVIEIMDLRAEELLPNERSDIDGD